MEPWGQRGSLCHPDTGGTSCPGSAAVPMPEPSPSVLAELLPIGPGSPGSLRQHPLRCTGWNRTSQLCPGQTPQPEPGTPHLFPQCCGQREEHNAKHQLPLHR